MLLCDSISLPSGFCLLEKRIVDVALRYGINEKSIPSWQARFRIKAIFEKEIGRSIYTLPPDLYKLTFGVPYLNDYLRVSERREMICVISMPGQSYSPG